MRREDLYLSDILEAIADIEEFIAGVDRETFLGDKLRRSAVLHELTIVGEAAVRLSPQFRARHPNVEWQKIAAFRNIVVHSYFVVDLSIVWVAATADAALLITQVKKILAEDFQGPP